MISIAADLMAHANDVVNFYHDNEEDIRRVCEPHWCITLNQTQAQEDAAMDLMESLPVDAVTSYLLVGMFFENNPH